MVFQRRHEGMDDFDILKSLPHTCSAYQHFYDDDPANLFEVSQHLPATSLVVVKPHDGALSFAILAATTWKASKRPVSGARLLTMELSVLWNTRCLKPK